MTVKKMMDKHYEIEELSLGLRILLLEGMTGIKEHLKKLSD